jgi:tRNA A-37 threonylcarbamoyl transferase component Bud32
MGRASFAGGRATRMKGVIENIIAGLAATFLIWLVSRLWRRSRPWIIGPPVRLAENVAADEIPPQPRVALPDGLSLPEKVAYLERRRGETLAEAIRTRSRGSDDSGYNQDVSRIEDELAAMSFLASGDELDDRYCLHSYLGGGRISVVWKAYDRIQDRVVAIKFLRHTYVNDESVVRRFHYSARLMSEFSTVSIASVREDVRELVSNGKLVYYVLEHVEGERLDLYAARHPDGQAAMIDGALELGRCLADAHARGIVHRDLKPANILVQPSGALKLVDFDSVLRLGDRRIAHQDLGTFGYSAPEVLNGVGDPDVRADIFALGRVFSYLYYGGSSLPNAYEVSVYDLIDLLNCAPVVKETLERGTAVSPEQRYNSMKAFLVDLEKAVRKDRDYALPLVQTVKREWNKITKLLRHSFFGTFAAMIVIRPIFAHLGLVHLSDRAWVGAFHAIIGSLVWGVMIPAAFIFYLLIFGRRLTSRTWQYAIASICCGFGGLFGGIIASVPSVFVTNDRTLTCLGWLTHPLVHGRLQTALFQTKMMLAYPLTGLFTGLGVGLCLYSGIKIALQTNTQGSGILPVPAKRPHRERQPDDGLLGRLLTSIRAHLFLAFPALFSFVVAFFLNASSPPEALNCTILPNEEWRSFGEGVVHYVGAIGLTIGFFFGIRSRKPADS